MLLLISLLDPASLPRAESPRQRPKSPRQRLCREPATWLSAKSSRQRSSRQRILCREPRGRLSAKTLPRARNALNKTHGAVEERQCWRRLCREPCWQALGKDYLFFLKKMSLPSARQAGSRQRGSLPRAIQAGARQRLFMFLWPNF